MADASRPSLSGPLYHYLGHFRQEKVVRQGHNDSEMDLIDQYYKGVMPLATYQAGGPPPPPKRKGYL